MSRLEVLKKWLGDESMRLQSNNIEISSVLGKMSELESSIPTVVEYKEYCEYTYKDYDYSNGKCRADTSCGIFWYGEIDLLYNFKHCPECGKEIKEVRRDQS
jgi:hypothetical protein